MAKIDPLKAGELITEGFLNRLVDQFERFKSIRSGSPYLLVDDGPHGKLIDLSLPQQTWALLSGASSPYSFTEVRDGPGGTWVSMPNGDSGTANVYEINGKSGLAGKVVPITWTAAGDWRFQWVGYGAPCDPASSFILVTVTDTCTGLPLSGATVTIKFGGSTVASGTTDGSGDFSTAITQAGNYTIDVSNTDYATRTGIAFNSVTCGTTNSTTVALTPTTGSLSVTVNGSCLGGSLVPYLPLAGASVVLTQGGTPVASGTTDGSGNVVLTGIPPGSTLITVSAAKFASQSSTVTIGAGCTPGSASFSLDLDSSHRCNCYNNGFGITRAGIASTTLQLTDSYFGATCTITYDPVSGSYKGSASVSFSCPGNCPDGSGTLFYEYFGGSGSGGSCNLRIGGPGYFPGGIWGTNLCFNGGTETTNTTIGSSGGSASPFSAVFEVRNSPSPNRGNLAFAYCSGDALVSTITITE